jgi:hypothetical protein|uniref:thiol oxidase n=1 Tax=viral metagenome TaxID=1070528 RepID=A0A6C0AII3_9ZZZZ
MKTRRVFKPQDMKSGDGMLTTVWGPSLWHYLHTMSFNYPVHPTAQDKKHYREFVQSLVHVLPCKYCRLNLVKNFKTLPLKYSDMESRDTFSRYVYKLHELINTMLGKKSNLSYCDIRERYEHFRARCTLNEPPKTEKGCTVPLVGKKSKGVIRIVPQEEKCESLQIDAQCLKQYKN